MQNKWALEEHLSTPENNQLWDDSGEAARNGKKYMDYVESHLLDVEDRIKIMDATGIERTIVSLTSPGIQSITDTELAVKVARDTNDLVKSKFVDQHPDRLSMFACLPTQDGTAAAAELRRAVGELGAVGALINGDTNITDANTVRYLDDDAYEPMWAAVEELDVPVYLHPREPLPAMQTIYAGYGSLVGSAWGFAHEMATHAVRLMLSGLFDRHPGVQVILGHLAEGLPFLLPRLEHRLDRQKDGTGLGSAQRILHRQLLRHHQRALPHADPFQHDRRARRGPGHVLRRLPLRVHGGGCRLVRLLPAEPQRRAEDRPGQRSSALR